MTTKNLWPDFTAFQDTPLSPKEVIRQAGEGLKEKTNGLVDFVAGALQVVGDTVDLTFSLWAPRLSYYYPFMKVHFPVATLYPVTITADRIDGQFSANNEGELVKTISRLFNEKSTVATIRQLISLSK